MRRTTKTGATVAGLAMLLAACGGGSSSSSGTASEKPSAATSTFTIWADEVRTKPIKAECDKFAAANGITCDVKQLDFGKIRETVVKQNATGDVPDVFIGAHDWLGELVKNGVVSPVDISANASKFSDVAVKAVTYEGKTYGVPYAVENVALLTNPKLAAECPATMEDLVKVGLDAKAKGATLPLALQVGDQGDAYHWHPLFSASGGYIFGQNPDGTYNPKDLGIGKEGGIEAGKKLAELGKQGVLKGSVTGDIAKEAFNGGKSPFFITGPWNVPDAKKAIPDLKICPVPTFAAGGKPSQAMIGVQTFFVPAKAKNAAIASTFLSDFVATTEFADAIYAADPRPPAWTESADKVSSDPIVKGFIDYGKQGIPQPAIPEMGSVWGDLGLAEFKILSGQDPEATMKAAGANIEKAIAAAG